MREEELFSATVGLRDGKEKIRPGLRRILIRKIDVVRKS
jgi:hypothetical protein